MAGSISVTTTIDKNLRKYSCDWTSDAAGAVSGIDVPVMGGQLVQVVFTPDGGGTAPTDLYDVTLTLSGGGTDLLGGAGANASSTLQVAIGADVANLPTWVPSGNLRPVVANAGNAKGGVIDLYFA